MLLDAAGIPFVRGSFPDVDETPPGGLPPPAVAQALAEAKARAVVPLAEGRSVLAADTVVFLGAEVLGKPSGPDEARRMLRRLSGRMHAVATGVAVARGGRLESGVAVSRVTFRPLLDVEVAAYVAGGEPLDKAGAYAIQGGAAGFVTCLEGEEDTVVGLPIQLVRRLLDRLGERGFGLGRAKRR